MEFKFTQEQLQELAKSQLEVQITKRINEELDDFDFKDYIENTLEKLIESYFKNKFMDTDNELDEYVLDTCKKESWLWIRDNYSHEDMEDIMARALVGRFSELKFSDLLELGKLVAGRERR